MACTSPRTVGFKSDCKTISWSPKTHTKEMPLFQLPCGKCIECRLDYARQWAIRCVHEASTWENNIFLTLTYSEENLKSDRLILKDFQEFIQKLRDKILADYLKEKSITKEQWKTVSKTERKEIYGKIRISYFVTGEYGDKTKRPHWHAIIFNYRPTDATYGYTTANNDIVHYSETIDNLWKNGRSEFGSVTMDSAGYCARYAAKKLSHGRDQEHNYNPISKKSSKYAIGRRWLEKNYQDVFSNGKLLLIQKNETITAPIPRYYERWLKKEKPTEYRRYLDVKSAKETKRQIQEIPQLTPYLRKSEVLHISQLDRQQQYNAIIQFGGKNKNRTMSNIVAEKFKLLQSYLKL